MNRGNGKIKLCGLFDREKLRLCLIHKDFMCRDFTTNLNEYCDILINGKSDLDY